MHALYRPILAALSLLCIAPLAGADAQSDAIDKVFANFQDATSPGCAVAASRDGATIFEKAYGAANLETNTPITPRSIFHMASVSKQFTAAAILLLARDGKLTLDDDIRKHLPEMPNYGTPITIRHLLHHTSGLRDQWDLLALARRRFEENRITEADVMDIVPRQKGLNFKPGAEYLYSNTGFTLLAVIVKRVSGKPLKEFADERIFQPLGMSATHFHDDYTMVVPGRTSAYSKGKDKKWHVAIPNYDTYGATSLFSTVGDLLKWQDNFRTLKVGDADMFRQMATVAVLNDGTPTTYGLGLGVDKHRGARLVGHSGADAGYRAYLGRFPDLGLSVAIACNASTARPPTLAYAVADALVGGRLDKTAESVPHVAATFAPAELAARAGVYIEPVTLRLIELQAVGTSLAAGPDHNATLASTGSDRYSFPGSKESMEFVDGARRGLRHHIPGRAPLFYEHHAAVAVTPAGLDAYKGQFVSPELLNARYRVTVKDNTLMVSGGTGAPEPMRQLYKNVFLLDGDLLRFHETRGRITGFDMSTGRVRAIRFERAAAQP